MHNTNINLLFKHIIYYNKLIIQLNYILQDSMTVLISLSLISISEEVKDSCKVTFFVREDSLRIRMAQVAPPRQIARSTYASAVLVSA